MSKPYEELIDKEKIKVMEAALGLLSLKPGLIKESLSYGDFLDELEKFAKELHIRFPDISKLPTVMIGRVTGL